MLLLNSMRDWSAVLRQCSGCVQHGHCRNVSFVKPELVAPLFRPWLWCRGRIREGSLHKIGKNYSLPLVHFCPYWASPHPLSAVDVCNDRETDVSYRWNTWAMVIYCQRCTGLCVGQSSVTMDRLYLHSDSVTVRLKY